MNDHSARHRSSEARPRRAAVASDPSGSRSAELERLAALFGAAPLAVLTGAGISTDSGIPDYRGAGTPPRTPMSIAQFMEDPAYRRRFWAGARVGALRAAGVAPNSGHLALARFEAAGLTNGVITQNVDNLHRRAGSRSVVELHGNGNVIRCTEHDHRFTRDQVLGWFDDLNPGFAARNAGAEIAPDGDALVSETATVEAPSCPECGSILRPDVVYFGELVPRPVFETAEALVAAAGGLLLIGTSLAVNTGIRLVHRAQLRGIPIAVINRGPTAIDARESVTVRIDAGAAETLAALERILGSS
ncbi:Sir2 family NAD-dependent protein deacetylase [Leucobacter chromiiresistens]|uniref:protein acetyllysine N-acetyltransferase n=1 Tax=Leucobacter chromiiresistens TaxID=1079994 RepID=A0A1H0YNY8_9MICO|nr:Sir2 family NAD-dependent protein deacetylase [Leucobacter chromiiresistens]SDQ16566.1 NAD-dependent protein deacetylase, SIR2 family [Leucobacter chromiiresistens]